MKKIIGSIVVFVIMSCGISPKTDKVQSVFQIKAQTVFQIERTPCFGKCPVYTIRLLDNQTIAYNGVKNVKPIGKQTIRLTDAEYKDFIQQIAALPFADYKLRYGKIIRDIALIQVTYKGKKITMTQGNVPEGLERLIQKFERKVMLNRP